MEKDSRIIETGLRSKLVDIIDAFNDELWSDNPVTMEDLNRFIANISYFVQLEDNDILESVRLIKNYCKNTHCGECQFFEKGNKCKLETKRDFNFNTVPKDWDI